MILIFNVLLALVFNNPINEINDEILFIGHAYGNPHTYYDEKIDPSLLSFFKKNDVSHYKYIIWGGDFIETCSNEAEVNNFFKTLPNRIIEKSIFLFGNHEFTCYDNDNFNFVKKNENQVIQINGYDLFFINSNFENLNDVNESLDIVQESSKKIIFTHQVIFSRNNWFLRTNSRDFYKLGNIFYDKLIETNNDFTIITGDVGAFKRMPYLEYFKDSDNNLIASGLGNSSNNYIVSLKFENNNLSFFKINLDNNIKTKLDPSNVLLSTLINSVQFFFFSKKRAVLFILLLITPFFYFLYKKIKNEKNTNNS
tara:strand:- start:320 stop:1252 length:933 start_codon:yes stop_codon:yes gene_type:complete